MSKTLVRICGIVGILVSIGEEVRKEGNEEMRQEGGERGGIKNYGVEGGGC